MPHSHYDYEIAGYLYLVWCDVLGADHIEVPMTDWRADEEYARSLGDLRFAPGGRLTVIVDDEVDVSR